MGQRHNRRRTRKPRAGKRFPTASDAFNPCLYAFNPEPFPTANGMMSQHLLPSSYASRERYAILPSAQTWHMWENVWQIREHVDEDESMIWTDERYRLFGGRPGDDESLCGSMMEFFGKLDYINT